MKLEPPTPKMGLEETLALTPPSRAEANPVIFSRIATAGEGLALSPRRDLPELCARLAPLNQPTRPLTPSLSPSEGERVPEGRERRRFMGREHLQKFGRASEP